MIKKIFNYSTILSALLVSCCSIFIYPEVVLLIVVILLSLRLYLDRGRGKKNLVILSEVAALATSIAPSVFAVISGIYKNRFNIDTDWKSLSKPQQDVVLQIIQSLIVDHDLTPQIVHGIYVKGNEPLRWVSSEYKSIIPTSKKWEELTDNEKQFWADLVHTVREKI